jgi:elongation factor G
VGAPQVAYREKLLKAGKANTYCAKQTGGRGQYAHVVIEIAAGRAGSGIVFNNKIVGGVHPERIYQTGGGRASRRLLKKGVLAGFPLEDFEINLVDGSHHEVDSSERAFFIAGSMAFKDAAKKAGLGLMEPIMKLEVTTPEEYLGDVMGDISSRRGKVQSMDSQARRAGGDRQCALGQHVRLCRRSAVGHSGTRHLLHGIFPLRTGSR